MPSLRKINFILNKTMGLRDVAAPPGDKKATPDLIDAVIGSAGKMASSGFDDP